LEKDKDVKKKRNEQATSTSTPFGASHERCRFDSTSSTLTAIEYSESASVANANSTASPGVQISGGAKKVNVEVIMKSNPFRVGKHSDTK
jgi:hypothetical protein